MLNVTAAGHNVSRWLTPYIHVPKFKSIRACLATPKHCILLSHAFDLQLMLLISLKILHSSVTYRRGGMLRSYYSAHAFGCMSVMILYPTRLLLSRRAISFEIRISTVRSLVYAYPMLT